MSLQRISNELQNDNLSELQALETIKRLLNDFHKDPSQSAVATALACEKYPAVLSRNIQGKTVFSLLCLAAQKYDSGNAIVHLTRAVLRTPQLNLQQTQHIDWLFTLVKNPGLGQYAFQGLDLMELSPPLEARVNRLKTSTRASVVKNGDRCHLQIREATELDDNPHITDDILRQLPSIVSFMLPETPMQPLTEEWKRALETILEQENYISNSEDRLLACDALLAIFSIYQPSFPLDHTSALGAWIIGCIRSSNRPLRLKAVRLLSSFITDDLPPEDLAVLLKCTLQLTLNETRQPINGHYETVLHAYAAGAVSCHFEHLNFFLLKLVNELSSSNPVKTSLALEMLQQIASGKKETPYQLFMPFWKTIAVIMVQKSDEVLTQFCALCSISKETFLVRTARATLPSLVLLEQAGIIQNIAKVSATSVDRLINAHAGPIVALLLTGSSSPEEFAERKLKATSRQSLGFGIRTIIAQKRAARDVLAELLKLSTSCESNRIITAIKYVYPESLDMDVIFNLIASFTQDLCFNKAGKLFPLGRVQYLKGLELLINSGIADMFSVRTQVFTLLQSQMGDNVTALFSLKVWLAMLQHLDDREDPQAWHFYDLSLAILTYKWPEFNSSVRIQGKKIFRYIADTADIDTLLKEDGILRTDDVYLQDAIEKGITNSKTHYSRFAQFRQIIRRCSQENFFIVFQSIKELTAFISANQDVIGIQLRSETEVRDLEDVIRILLSAAKRFDHPELRNNCAECLGLLGAFDPYRLNIEANPAIRTTGIKPLEAPVVIDSFGTAEESNLFVAYVIEQYLLPELQATADPDVQMYVGFVIQEFLKFCGFSSSSRSQDLDTLFKPNANDHDSLLSPFLYTKYKVKSILPPSEREYPIYKTSMLYSDWLQNFTFDVMCRANGGNAQVIFGLLRYLFSKKDREGFKNFETLAKFTLPYAILNAILYIPETVNQFALEFTTVLNQSVDMQTSMIHQTVFSIFDYIAVWTREKRASSVGAKELSLVGVLNQNVSPFTLGQRAFECQNYPRAIRYWEQALKLNQLETDMRDDVLNRFTHLYADLGDVDSMEGISTQIKSLSLEQKILQYKKTEQWDAALTSYALLANKLGSWNSELLEGTLECYRLSGQPEQVLNRLSASDKSLITPNIVDMAVESSWRSDNWSEFDKWCKMGSSSLTQYIAQGIAALKWTNRDQFQISMYKGKALAMEEIVQHEVISLTQIRTPMIFLHAICDINSISDFLYENSDVRFPKSLVQLGGQSQTGVIKSGQKLSTLLYNRLDRAGTAFDSRDFLLSLRRIVFEAGPNSGLEKFLKGEIAGTFYNGARDARKSKHFVKAIEYVLKALELKHPLASREHAKLLWSQGSHEQALRTLAVELNNFDHNPKSFKSQTSFEFAKNALLYTEWLDSSGYATTEELVDRYNAISKMHQKWDKVFQRKAKHYLKIYEYQVQMDPSNREDTFYDGTLFRNICDALMKVLRYGSKYVEETMPKFLTLWLDFTSESEESIKAQLAHRSEGECRTICETRVMNINSWNHYMISTVKSGQKIPSYFFYDALPQLLSRITSVKIDAFKIIKELIRLVCSKYPAESVWSLIEATKSSLQSRRNRGKEILEVVRGTQPVAINAALEVIEQFLEFCARDISHEKSRTRFTLKQLHFDSTVISNNGSHLVVPIQQFLERVLPAPGAEFRKHNPFPSTARFWSVENDVQVMPSLQRPKKIVVNADNGRQYSLLCKGSDDVRKDSRLLNFATSINRLLDSDDAAVARHLHVLSYKVVPLMEKGGIIEWVDGATPTRKLIREMAALKGNSPDYKRINAELQAPNPPNRQLKVFENILKNTEPVLYDWFLYSFPDPAAWLKARNSYTQSTAVMSIVGYILGLGDRHLENLLIVEHTGCCLHVDFDCLFDKGAFLTVPEIVPFRLTQNMVDAFGAHGYEGPFRKSCEITLGLLHKNESLLMTILEPFVHDPVALSESQKKNKVTPKNSLQKIKKKLMLYKMPSAASSLTVSAPLSVQGLVEDLIKIATDPGRLCRMYVGWCPYL